MAYYENNIVFVKNVFTNKKEAQKNVIKITNKKNFYIDN